MNEVAKLQRLRSTICSWWLSGGDGRGGGWRWLAMMMIEKITMIVTSTFASHRNSDDNISDDLRESMEK